MAANNSAFKAQYEAAKNMEPGASGTIRVGDLMNNPNVKFIDNTDPETGEVKDVMPNKLSASRRTDWGSYGLSGDSLHTSIRKHGVRAPVSIAFPNENEAVVVGGHHRIAAAHDIDPNMEIPWKPGLSWLPEKYDSKAANCPTCGGNGADERDLNRHYKRLENYDEEFEMSQVKPCHSCSGKGVI